MTTMMALTAHPRGGPEGLVYASVDRPEPGPGELQIEVHAAGVTPAELDWDRTWWRDGPRGTPVIPSRDVSGVVSGLGPGVSDFHIGDAVCALLRFNHEGGAAEYAVAQATEVAAKPVTVPHAAAAALPLAALTAWQALVVHGRLRRGDRVLVHGGAGGVGSFAVQLATQLGGQVTATARGTDADLVQSLGADRVLDFVTAEPLPAGFDVILDTVGGAVLDASYAAVRSGGRLITLPSPPAHRAAAETGVEATFFRVSPDRFELARLARMVDRGELQVLIAATFPLHQGRDAFESAVAPRRPGKTVLQVIRQDVEYAGSAD